jgi:hypothetical protein
MPTRYYVLLAFVLGNLFGLLFHYGPGPWFAPPLAAGLASITLGTMMDRVNRAEEGK